MGAALPAVTVSFIILTILIAIISITRVCVADLVYYVLPRRLALCQMLLVQCLMSSPNKSVTWVVTISHSADEDVEAQRNK